LLTCNVTDRFADYGVVGALLIQGSDIVQFVMSCRVLGMEIERAAAAQGVSLIRSRAEAAVTASVKHTADNTPCREVYSH
jgi:predicted enzyme involved in methoxymalonyl-ACP biosynthesis